MLSKAMDRMPRTPPNLSEYLTVRKAAQLLGVSVSTLRNWDRCGKLKPVRNPLNGYRLYRLDHLLKLLGNLDRQGKQ